MRRLHMLVADDNPVNRRLVAALFEGRGDTVVQVEDGARALATYMSAAFDVILMDLEMPTMDGLAATRAIREAERATGRHVPIVALTSRALPADRAACLDAGMDAHLTKPACADELFPLVARLVSDGDGRGHAGRWPHGASIDHDAPHGASINHDAPHGASINHEAPHGASINHEAPHGASIDHEALLDRMEGDRALLAEVVAIFQIEAPRMLADLRHALDAGDATALQRAAHSCKGAVAIFGAPRASESAQALETLGRSGSVTGAAEILGALERQVTALSHDLEALGPEAQE